MTMTSSAMTVSAQSGKAENAVTCTIALTIAKKIAVQRAQLWPLSRPPAVRPMMTPRTRWTHPQVVKSRTITPLPPTVTTSSLRIAARPQIELKNAATNSTTPAKVAQPVGTNSSRGTDVLEGEGVEVAMTILSTGFQPGCSSGQG